MELYNDAAEFVKSVSGDMLLQNWSCLREGQ
jgi:hypothetical protein